MFNILVVEDNQNIRKLMEVRLKNEGYNTFLVENGIEALKCYEKNSIDLMIVDVMMPKMNGIELVKILRETKSQVPIIMVTAKDSMEDKAKGFLVGIDDYMVKPVNFDELVFRIKALLRRARIVSERKIVVNDIVINYDNFSILRTSTGQIVNLPKKEFNILFKLLSYPERVFTKAQLFDEFWGIDSESDEDTIKVHINKIRNKISCFKEIGIETIRGLGYKGVKHEK